MNQKPANEIQLLMFLKAMGFAVNKVILDCKRHFCKTVNSNDTGSALYVAHCGENSYFLYAVILKGSYILHHAHYDFHFDNTNVTKEELISIITCYKSVYCLK